MLTLNADHPRATALVDAIRSGDVVGLKKALDADPDLATARIVAADGSSRTPLHFVTDWPGHFPDGATTVATLIAAGAEVDAPIIHSQSEGSAETPLHWAASSNDVAVLDALLDGGANIEAPGAVITGGTPMSDAVIFAQWDAARRLLERGAATTIWQAAALGAMDSVREHVSAEPPAEQTSNALWHACRGGQLETAEYLVEHGGDPHWVGHDQKTPLDVARESGVPELVEWLEDHAGGAGR